MDAEGIRAAIEHALLTDEELEDFMSGSGLFELFHINGTKTQSRNSMNTFFESLKSTPTTGMTHASGKATCSG